MHRSSIEMVGVMVSEGDLQTISCLNAQNHLWTVHKLISELIGELNGTLNYELDV